MKASAFQPPYFFAPYRSQFAGLSVAKSKKVVVTRQRPVRPYFLAVTPLPDDTALDMLSFALSGPAVFTTGAFILGGLGFLLSFAEFGPRREEKVSTSFLVQIVLSNSCRAEFTDGSVKTLRTGENLIKLKTREECTAITRALEQYALSWDIFRIAGMEMKLVEKFPREIDAKGASWPTNVVDQRDKTDIGARWEEYEQIGYADDKLEKDWKRVIDDLSPIQFVNKNQSRTDDECRLCGGTGLVTCHKCRGASANMSKQATYRCDCTDGKRSCEWCNS